MGIIFKEGYWNNDRNDYPELPRPRAIDQPWKGRRSFLKALGKVEARFPGNRYKGFSRCRICGQMNGSSDHSASGWVWPEGFRHYVEAHNVRPSTAFIDLITHLAANEGGNTKSRDNSD